MSTCIKQRASAAVMLAAVLASTAMAAPQAAAAVAPAMCVYDGASTSLTPIPVVGSNTGSYVWNGTARCFGAAGVFLFTTGWHASGTYDNVQCGTGTVTGTMTIDLVDSFSFAATVTGGVGVLRATSGGTGGGPIVIVPQAGGCVTVPVSSQGIHGEYSPLAA